MLYISADTLVTWEGMKNSVTGAFVNDATVSAVLQTPTPYTFPLEYEPDSDGDYIGTIPASITAGLTQGTEYLLQITAVESTAQDYRQEYHIAQYKGLSV